MILQKTLLLAVLIVSTACPRKFQSQESPGTDIGRSPLTDYSWDPSVVFPDIDLPQIQPDPLTELANGIPADAVRLTPATLGDGSVLNDPDKWFFVVEPGDYTAVARFSLEASGTQQRRRVIMSVGAPPWERSPENRARFDAFDVRGDNWLFYNLEFSGKSLQRDGLEMGNVSRLVNVDHVTFSHCFWRNSISGLRVYGNYNTIQFCAFTDKPGIGVDIGGVGIFASTGKESRGNRVLGCEFKGMSDGAGVPWNPGVNSGSTPATVIAYNHAWVPKSMYRELRVEDQIFITACAEDGYDIKNGSLTNDPADRSLFIGNVSRGHRVTDQDCGGSGSTGASWIFHRRARNWLIAGNLGYDDALGCYVKGYSKKEDGKDKVQAIVVRNNVFADLAAEYPGGIAGMRENPDNGLAFRVLCPTCEVYENIVVNAQRDVFEKKRNQARFRDNLFVNVRERSESGHRSESEVRWQEVEFKASPLLDPKETLTIRVPLEK